MDASSTDQRRGSQRVDQATEARRPKRVTMPIFAEGAATYYCGKPRKPSRVHKTHAWAMEATGEAVLKDCELCKIVTLTWGPR